MVKLKVLKKVNNHQFEQTKNNHLNGGGGGGGGGEGGGGGGGHMIILVLVFGTHCNVSRGPHKPLIIPQNKQRWININKTMVGHIKLLIILS
jgi:hypothetical protein